MILPEMGWTSSGVVLIGMSTGMSDGKQLADSLKRLNRAMDLLEKAVDSRLEREAALSDAEAEVQRMGADRTRLAESLDAAEERAQQLAHVNKEVSRRLVDAMETIRSVIDRRQNA